MQIREFGTSWIVNQLIRKEGKSSTCIATRIEILLVFSEMASFYRTQASIIFYAITHVSRWLINDRTLKIVELTLVDVIKYLRNVDVEMKLRYARREGWVLPDSIQCLNFAEKMIQFTTWFNITHTKFKIHSVWTVIPQSFQDYLKSWPGVKRLASRSSKVRWCWFSSAQKSRFKLFFLLTNGQPSPMQNICGIC